MSEQVFDPTSDIEVGERGRVYVRLHGELVDLSPAEAAVLAGVLREAAQAADGKLARKWQPSEYPKIVEGPHLEADARLVTAVRPRFE